MVPVEFTILGNPLRVHHRTTAHALGLTTTVTIVSLLADARLIAKAVLDTAFHCSPPRVRVAAVLVRRRFEHAPGGRDVRLPLW